MDNEKKQQIASLLYDIKENNNTEARRALYAMYEGEIKDFANSDRNKERELRDLFQSLVTEFTKTMPIKKNQENRLMS